MIARLFLSSQIFVLLLVLIGCHKNGAVLTVYAKNCLDRDRVPVCLCIDDEEYYLASGRSTTLSLRPGSHVVGMGTFCSHPCGESWVQTFELHDSERWDLNNKRVDAFDDSLGYRWEWKRTIEEGTESKRSEVGVSQRAATKNFTISLLVDTRGKEWDQLLSDPKTPYNVAHEGTLTGAARDLHFSRVMDEMMRQAQSKSQYDLGTLRATWDRLLLATAKGELKGELQLKVRLGAPSKELWRRILSDVASHLPTEKQADK